MSATTTVLVNGSTVVAMLIGIVVPAITSFITRASLPQPAKAALTLLMTSIAAVAVSVVTWPTTGSAWLHLLLNVLMTFLAAAAADKKLWGELGLSKEIHQVTDRHFGIGTYDPNLTLT